MDLKRKRKVIYKGSAKNWVKMMNKIYGPMCKFTLKDYHLLGEQKIFEI